VVAEVETDLLIVGAGPAGLFGAYYAGFRGMSVTLVDSLPELGGQVSALYPEKLILDVAGFPSIKGRELVEELVKQAASAHPTYLLDRTATSLKSHDEGVRMELDDGTVVQAKVVIITAGIGKFTPRPLPAGDGWEDRGLVFFVPSFAEYAGRDVVIVGGGDSAFDWAHSLEPIAKSVTLVHRRDKFRAHQATVDAVLASSTEVITQAQVTALNGEHHVESVEITTNDGDVLTRPAQAVVAALGFVADLSAMAEWGLEFEKRHIKVDPAMKTSVPRVFAAGDITEYDGKVRLIAVGFGEVATAVNNAAVVVDPEAHVFPGHSSEGS
jgi:ferredoxin/flavodoxin---NADP+ reductase